MRSTRRLLPFLMVLALTVGAQAASTASITDDQITLAIESQLAFDDRVSSHMIDVLTADGIVTLEGSVDKKTGGLRT